MFIIPFKSTNDNKTNGQNKKRARASYEKRENGGIDLADDRAHARRAAPVSDEK